MKYSYFVSGVERYRIDNGHFYIPAPDFECLMEISKEEFIAKFKKLLGQHYKGDGLYENYEKLIELANKE